MRVGVFFAVPKTHAMLRNQSTQQMKHVTWNVRVGILVDRESRGGVLHVEDNHTFLFARSSQFLLHLIGELNQLFALSRTDFQGVQLVSTGLLTGILNEPGR